MILKRSTTVFVVILASTNSMQLFAMDNAAENVGAAVSAVTGSRVIGGMAEKVAEKVVQELNNPEIGQKIQDEANKAIELGEKKAKEVQQDFSNIFSDMAHSVHTMKSPAIAKQAAVLSMQGKYAQAQVVRKKAKTPYYGYGVVSAIAGTTLLATVPFSKEGGKTVEASALCFATSLGCYYKTRHDLSKLKTGIEKEYAAKNLQHLFREDKKTFHNYLVAASKIKVAKKNDKKSSWFKFAL